MPLYLCQAPHASLCITWMLLTTLTTTFQTCQSNKDSTWHLRNYIYPAAIPLKIKTPNTNSNYPRGSFWPLPSVFSCLNIRTGHHGEYSTLHLQATYLRPSHILIKERRKGGTGLDEWIKQEANDTPSFLRRNRIPSSTLLSSRANQSNETSTPSLNRP